MMHTTVDTLDLSTVKPGDHITLMVHLGSACGSANFNLGDQRAQHARAGLLEDLQTVTGHLLVLAGGLDDEIADFAELLDALETALQPTPGGLRAQILAHDPDQVDITKAFVDRLGALAFEVSFEVTGAWLDDYDPGERGGCVGSVYEALKAKGLSNIAISDNAVVLETDF